MYANRVLTRMERGEELRAQGRAHLLMAGVLLDQGQAGDAARHLDQAAAVVSEEAPVELALLSYERARAALAAGDLAAARRHAEASAERTQAAEPGSAGMACAVLAEIALAERRLDDARELCHEAIRLMADRAAPTYVARAYETLSHVEEAAGNLEAALEALRSRPDVGAAKPA
jgi:tetratricopeptide (TPR) repeat protein